MFEQTIGILYVKRQISMSMPIDTQRERFSGMLCHNMKEKAFSYMAIRSRNKRVNFQR
jgi:hypothetical protein